MTNYVKKAGDRTEFPTRERCFIRELANIGDISRFSIAECRVAPGVTTELHSLSVDEWYVMLHGTGMVEVNHCEPVKVSPGDVVEIPAGTAQRITNHDTEDLLFLGVCLPRFTPDTYTALED